MNTDEMLTGRLTRTVEMGKYHVAIPAGTLVEVRTEAVESGARCVYAHVAGRSRLSAVLPMAIIEVA